MVAGDMNKTVSVRIEVNIEIPVEAEHLDEFGELNEAGLAYVSKETAVCLKAQVDEGDFVTCEMVVEGEDA